MEPRDQQPSPIRLLAPIAIIVFGVALLLILSSGGSSGGSSSTGPNAAEKRDLGATTRTRTKRHRQRTSTSTTSTTPSGGVYVVKQGDTLAGIAEKTQVTVERLQELNPGLDQFSLVAGQRIKLR